MPTSVSDSSGYASSGSRRSARAAVSVGDEYAVPPTFGASGVGYVDAPVSGGSEGAQKATLTIFAGYAAQVRQGFARVVALKRLHPHITRNPEAAGMLRDRSVMRCWA